MDLTKIKEGMVESEPLINDDEVQTESHCEECENAQNESSPSESSALVEVDISNLPLR